jgi:hypothetical protein
LIFVLPRAHYRDEAQDPRAGGESLHVFFQVDGVIEVFHHEGQPDPEQQPEDEPEDGVAYRFG